MLPHQIEHWALSIIDRVESHQPIEDTRVELKAEWIPPVRAARRLAGHANAARGAPILWLVGVDEVKGVVGAAADQSADWHSAVCAQFEGLAPYITDINVPVRDVTVTALLVETDRAPFVVKNPLYGATGGGPVELEVPWREGTKVRSARRSELLRLLSPLQPQPVFEVLEGTLEAHATTLSPDEPGLHWSLALTLYAETALDSPVVIPFHRSRADFTVIDQVGWTRLESLSLQPPESLTFGATPGGSKRLSLTIDATRDEVIVGGPGKVNLTAWVYTQPYELRDTPAGVMVSMLPVGAEHPLTIRASLEQSPPPRKGVVAKWSLTEANAGLPLG